MFAALGDPLRLEIVDALALGDLTVSEIRGIVDIPGNALAHHLGVLERADVLQRRVSEGDRRRRYVTLSQRVVSLVSAASIDVGASPLFVCTHNSARSQFAAALWTQETGGHAESAGTHPASSVNETAVAVAAEYGLDLSSSVPKAYHDIEAEPTVVVSVCDQAREELEGFTMPRIHWSIPDPVRGVDPNAFRTAFDEIADRLERLTRSAEHP